MKVEKNILFLVPYQINRAPGQRFRFEHYLDELQKKGYNISIHPFFNKETNEILYSKGKLFSKIYGVTQSFISRFRDVFATRNYQVIYIFRELAPIGPPLFEWLLKSFFKGKIIYDFDDAIWLSDTNETKFISFVKCKWKIKYILKWSTVVSCGNDYLMEYARRYNKNVTLLPTVVDTDKSHYPRKIKKSNHPVIGWTGSHSTLVYLDKIYTIFEKLYETTEFTFKVICNRRPKVNYPWLKFTEWSKESEIEDLAEFDIGIMPLDESPWSKGKCGFKLIQYLALEIPAVANPVGINKNIIINGRNGYLCDSEEEWLKRLKELLNDPEKRKKMGVEGRKLIINSYSVEYASPLFFKLLE